MMGILHISDKNFKPIESIPYKGTKGWVKIIKELGTKYSPDTNIHDEHQDEAGTVTYGDLGGCLVSIEIAEQDKIKRKKILDKVAEYFIPNPRIEGFDALMQTILNPNISMYFNDRINIKKFDVVA